ncbi:hypothetical protein EYF80_037577 [Liparis tanakae]|uniref:Uncharacterized protein n=1 Tax=Liparis tanakae TaxID=230148 RepID=A0A4Z2GG62_9TELE|nr:hypothetical protein EYF80_037577 [Liparis tanakae]
MSVCSEDGRTGPGRSCRNRITPSHRVDTSSCSRSLVFWSSPSDSESVLKDAADGGLWGRGLGVGGDILFRPMNST